MKLFTVGELNTCGRILTEPVDPVRLVVEEALQTSVLSPERSHRKGLTAAKHTHPSTPHHIQHADYTGCICIK